MKQLKSQFSPQIYEYGNYRKSLKYSETHMHFLTFFDGYCADNFKNNTTITPDMIKAWFDDERDKRPGCLRDAYFSINGFLKFIHREECILSREYLQRKPSPQIPYLMSEEEITCFFNALNNAKWCDPLSGFCLKVMIRLLYSSGLRPNEARTLKQNNVNLQNGELVIEHTKRHTDRIVIVSKDMLDLMREYDVQRRIFVASSEYFFVRSNGEMITQHVLWETVNRCWKKVNYPNKEIPAINPYSFRHQFASTVLMKWIDEGKDLFSMIPYLKAYMGHSHYSSTVYYIHMLPQRLLNSKAINWDAIDKIGKEPDIWEK